ncbi:hypothetical protein RHMOL_Rhmol04G0225000 [Rhododendron molle]|uniref:Uncharacterized protein n=1 Tax=Rhododendron molle TaxID=49168 RepID=A0ACC0P5R4_RHOML|nr:hypothetical protein RHMOL_Rhmol04G0225000 [Rhododendron molle]
MYPIAMAVVESELKSSWTWFFELLTDVIGKPQDKGWGRTESMIVISWSGAQVSHETLRFQLPKSAQREGGKGLKDLMWGATNAYTLPEYQAKMRELRAVSMEAHNWLIHEPPKNWVSCFYSPVARTNRMVNNLSESFNNAIKKVRDQPILTMMESLRKHVMQRYVERTKSCSTFKTNICPNIVKKLEIEKASAMEFSVMYCAPHKFEIWSPYKSFIVDIELNTCSCRKWEVTGIPCRHACAAMIKDRRKPEDFISPYFLTDTFRKSYAYLINPIPNKSMWMRIEFEDIMPPPYRRKSGRPKKTRRKGAKEALAQSGTIFKCRKCNQPGHNARTCKAHVSSTSAEVGESSTSQVVTREGSPCPLIPIGRKDVSSGVRRGRGTGRGVPRGRGLSRSRGVVIGVPTGGGRGVARGVTTGRVVTRSWAFQWGVTLGTGVGRGMAARGGMSRGKEVVVVARGVLRGKPVVVAAKGGLSRGQGVAVQIGGDKAVEIGGTRNDQIGASGVARAVQIDVQPSLPTLVRNGKKVIFKSALGGGYQPGWKIARIGDGVFSSQVYNGITKGSTQ